MSLILYRYSILVNKYSGNCNDINNPYAKLCVPDVLMNIKIFNLMPRISETRHASWHETCTCTCISDVCVCNNIHNYSNKCWCEYKEMIDKVRRDDEFI